MRRAVAFGLAALLLAACDGQQKAIEQDLPAARATKARADVQHLAAAVRLYQAASGTLPASLAALTQGSGGAPILVSIPSPPKGWSAYVYTRYGSDLFSISATGDGVTVSAPE